MQRAGWPLGSWLCQKSSMPGTDRCQRLRLYSDGWCVGFLQRESIVTLVWAGWKSHSASTCGSKHIATSLARPVICHTHAPLVWFLDFERKHAAECKGPVTEPADTNTACALFSLSTSYSPTKRPVCVSVCQPQPPPPHCEGLFTDDSFHPITVIIRLKGNRHMQSTVLSD